mmetsp:Transcript_67421/g.160833  ORF Transcript_67421/g.160833 Transcript_67421/m.160833 type:complete len:201 (-) Transcript_67421:4275-4877(-)
MPVMSAPVSINASASSATTSSSKVSTVQAPSTCFRDITPGSVKVVNIAASSPGAKWQRPRPLGSSSVGVPLKPTRRAKSISAPSSWPLAESFLHWNLMYLGKTNCSKYHWITEVDPHRSLKISFICVSLERCSSAKGGTPLPLCLGASGTDGSHRKPPASVTQVRYSTAEGLSCALPGSLRTSFRSRTMTSSMSAKRRFS